METIFIAGVYGVGKSTLCKEISQLTNIPYFSAGDLIGRAVGENYDINKNAKNISKNQMVLRHQVKKLLLDYEKIILAGHFSVFNSQGEICCVNDDLFNHLYISQIILLEADPAEICKHLLIRDKWEYDIKQINDLLNYERITAENISKLINVDVIYYKMMYDGKDANKCVKQLFNVI